MHLTGSASNKDTLYNLTQLIISLISSQTDIKYSLYLQKHDCDTYTIITFTQIPPSVYYLAVYHYLGNDVTKLMLL